MRDGQDTGALTVRQRIRGSQGRDRRKEAARGRLTIVGGVDCKHRGTGGTGWNEVLKAVELIIGAEGCGAGKGISWIGTIVALAAHLKAQGGSTSGRADE